MTVETYTPDRPPVVDTSSVPMAPTLLAIRDMRWAGHTFAPIAARTGLSPVDVERICLQRGWYSRRR